MAAGEPPWNAAATVCGLRIDPSNNAEYAVATEAQAADIAVPGAENRLLHACRTVVSLKAISRPPSTSAATIARNVTTAGLPAMTASMMILALRPALGRAGRSGSAAVLPAAVLPAAVLPAGVLPAAGAGSPDAWPGVGVCSLMMAPWSARSGRD